MGVVVGRGGGGRVAFGDKAERDWKKGEEKEGGRFRNTKKAWKKREMEPY